MLMRRTAIVLDLAAIASAKIPQYPNRLETYASSPLRLNSDWVDEDWAQRAYTTSFANLAAEKANRPTNEAEIALGSAT